MAYQNVGTPKFYINVLEWLHSKGTISIPSFFMTLPVAVKQNPDYTTVENIPSGVMGTKNFLAVLGHVLGDSIDLFGVWDSDEYIGSEGVTDIINSDGSEPEYNGFSIMTFNNAEDIISVGQSIIFFVESEQPYGSVIIGSYYDMPHSPDLNLTMTREYGGIKNIETWGGASLSNAFYTSPPDWGTRKAWQLGDTDLSISGRRVWDLSFSYLSDKDVFQDNLKEIATEGESGWELDSDLTPDFTSEVIHKTNGGQLPFIFQPDSSNNSPDQFAICKLDMNSFSFQQTAPGLYSVKMKIRETW